MDWRRSTFDFHLDSGKFLDSLITIEAYKRAIFNTTGPDTTGSGRGEIDAMFPVPLGLVARSVLSFAAKRSG